MGFEEVYMGFIQKKTIYKYFLVLAFLILAFAIIISSAMGVADISFVDSLRIIVSRIPLVGRLIDSGSIRQSHYFIVLNVRLPRILLSALIGVGLSVVGSAFQSMFRNPMADPYILGVSSGASAGATIAIVLGFGSIIGGLSIITLFAFLGAIFTIIVVYNIARVGNKVTTLGLILAGVAVGLFLSSMVSLLMFFNRDDIEKIVMWTMGSVSAATWSKVGILTPVVLIGSFIIITYSRDLNAMSIGDETAKSLGIEVERVKKILLTVSSLIVASCVSTSGVIGFVGLIVPHTIRLIVGSDQRAVLPFSALSGAIFMVICDVMARNLIPPAEIPVGALTSLFGAPFFIFMLYKNKKKVI